MPHVCPLHHWIYYPIAVWRRVGMHWHQETRATTLTAAEARMHIALLEQLATELERIETAERESVTRAEGVVVRAAA